ncbi:uncharacterized protein MONBRDRAFT_38789 [Monosiga brevicollis MX1]|uniref:TauD/TfdA-like domain-containing protein n=1 Tax=Monosiga brevicollis TaxID=81824 RepID=A9VA54_MONBE|nr:uncharacterized protein MONBRDRAFT_38789 [Monosiga brevicollis MX1]EDQ85605.1 predicted protein [Monosiga brevicollis MX1]|eukprot:XP_001749554.1 hypothetical protein [Monosiga brevicollis MX1]
MLRVLTRLPRLGRGLVGARWPAAARTIVPAESLALGRRHLGLASPETQVNVLPRPSEGHPHLLAADQSDSATLTLEWSTGQITTLDLAWAFHQCRCSTCVQAGSGQRQRYPPDNALQHNEELQAVRWQPQQGHVELDVARPTPTGLQVIHTVVLPEDALARSLRATQVLADTRRTLTPLNLVEPANLAVHRYTDVVQGDTPQLFAWLDDMANKGAALLVDAPAGDPDARVVDLAARISQPMPTIYGATFDVVATENPINIAYSSVALDLHQDLVYYESTPGLQFLHCADFHETIEGGESLLMDGLAVAARLRDQDPDAYHLLQQVPMTFEKVHYDRALPAHLVAQRPIITADPESGEPLELVWAPPFEGALPFLEPGLCRRYFDAYAALGMVIRESTDLLIEHRLLPNETLCFNNRRMLHGRRSFVLHEGHIRFLKGVYVNIDEFVSRHTSLSQLLGLSLPTARYGHGVAPMW